MAKATIVKITEFNGENLTVQTTTGIQFKVLFNNNEFLELCEIPSCKISINDAAKIMIGCFNKRSTFFGIDTVYFNVNGRRIGANASSKIFGIVKTDIEH